MHSFYPALERAIDQEDLEALRSIVEESGSPNLQMKAGDLLLHHCCERGFSKAVHLLLELGAAPDTPGREGFTPAMVCSVNDAEDCLAEVLNWNGCAFDTNELSRLLILAAQHDSIRVTQLLLDRGADPNFHDSKTDGRTALHWAAQEGNVLVIELLCERGANPDAFDADGFTALHIAAGENNTEVLQTLISWKADLDLLCSGDGFSTALHIACAWQNEEAVALLLENGADPTIRNDEDETALDIATNAENERLVALFTSNSDS